jgi:hypothetical protein
VPNVKPTQVGTQFLGVPSTSQRDAAIEAIKMAPRKPQKLWGNLSDRDDDTADQDRTDDLDENDADEDADDSNAKNPGTMRSAEWFCRCLIPR